MTMPLVTVITPSFNRAAFIEDTIRSVSSQTYSHVEHIVVDGASSDDTVSILELHAKAGTVRYLSEPDSGMYDAINKGISMANGDILCYLNTDDRYFPWSLEVAVDFFSRNPIVDIVYGDTLVKDLINDREAINILPSFSSAWLRCGGIIPQPTVFFRRRVLDKIGNFQRDVQYLADCEYWLRADQAGMKIKKINEILAVEINHGDTIRQCLTTALIAEKRLLVATYVRRSLFHYKIPALLLRAKYVEKELLTLTFVLGSYFKFGQSWSKFKNSFRVKLNIPRYFADKLLRTKSDIWKLESLNA